MYSLLSNWEAFSVSRIIDGCMYQRMGMCMEVDVRRRMKAGGIEE